MTKTSTALTKLEPIIIVGHPSFISFCCLNPSIFFKLCMYLAKTNMRISASCSDFKQEDSFWNSERTFMHYCTTEDCNGYISNFTQTATVETSGDSQMDYFIAQQTVRCFDANNLVEGYACKYSNRLCISCLHKSTKQALWSYYVEGGHNFFAGPP